MFAAVTRRNIVEINTIEKKKNTMRRSHRRFELSLEPVSSSVPAELIATEVISPRWPVSVFTQRPEERSQNLTV